MHRLHGSNRILATLLAGWTVAAPAGPAADAALDPVDYDAVLRDVVRDGGVDYRLLRDRHLDTLERYLAAVAGADVGRLSREQRLSLYVNVYNATVLHEVARRLEPGYRVSQDDFRLFHEPLVRVGGRSLTLDELENEVIRREFGDPRVHAALVCASRSCPALGPRAYRAESLDAALEAAMLSFLNDPQRNRVRVAQRRLELSRIFDWYAEDFGGKAALAGWVDPYVEGDVSQFEVAFLDYSWEPNVAPAPRPAP